MQLKLYRYLTLGSLIMAVILLGGAGYLIVNRNTFANFTTAIVIYVLVAFVISIIYKFLENNIDKINQDMNVEYFEDYAHLRRIFDK